ncbi:oligosaccharide flippase family protein, partial [Acinetobacter baumannii]
MFWGGGGTLLRIVMQFGAQVVLARILGPEQYGLFAIGAIVVGFSSFFSDIGLAYGLIQKKEIAAKDIRFVFTWQIILGA